MARSGSTRGMIALPQRRRAFTLQPATRTGAAPGISRTADFKAQKTRAGWQQDALTYYETLPPVGFVMDFKATTVAACDFNVMVDTPAGRVPVEKDERVDRLMASLVGPRGGIEELQRRAALLLEITGEAYFVGTPVEDQSEAVWWEFLSIEEVLPPDTSAGAGAAYRRDFGNGEKLDMPPDAYIARMWRSDARISSRAHCGLRRCLDTCRELVLLSRMTEAIIASRLPMGLLLIPDTIEWNSTLTRTDETAGSDVDVADESDFLDDLIQHLSAPITDFGNAATMVPLVVRANKDDLDAIKVVDLARSLDQYAAGLRDEMYGRLAVGLDIPPEILEGKGSLNHWTSFNIDNEFLFKHVVPVGKLIADFLTYAYLRPFLEAEGVPVDKAADYHIEFDASPLANNQDDDQKARDLWDQLLISDRAVIEKQGWEPDAMMPDKEERTRRLVERMVLAKVVSLSDEGAVFLGLDPTWFAVADPRRTPPAEFGQPPLESIPGVGLVPAEGNATPETVNPQQKGPPEQPAASDATKGNGQSGPPSRQARAGVTELLLARQLATAADGAYFRALEVAGARLIAACQKVPAFRGRFHATRRADVPSALSSTDLGALKVNAPMLLDGAWDEFGSQAADWLRDYLVRQGAGGPAAEADAARLTAGLVAEVAKWGVANFHGARVRDRSTGLRVPADVFAATVAEAQSRRTLAAVS